MNVAIVTDYLPQYHKIWSGAELIAVSLSDMLKGRGCSTFFITTPFDFPVQQLNGDIFPVNTPLKRLGTLSRNFPIDFPAIRNVQKVLKDKKADIVHINAKYLFLPALIASLGLNIPAVFTVPDYFIFCPTSFLRKPDGSSCEAYCGRGCCDCLPILSDGAMKKLAGLAPAVLISSLLSLRAAEFKYLLGKVSSFIALSEKSKKRLCEFGISQEKVRVAYHYRLAEPGETQEEIDNPAAIFVGWLSEENGTGVLVDAFGEVVDAMGDARLYLVGEGTSDYVTRLRERVDKRGIRKNIIFLGKRKNEEVLSLVSKCDVAVVPHQWPKEFGPVILLEALALGKPVITSGIGATEEYVKDGENGFIVKDYRDAAPFAEKIKAVLSEPEMARKMGEKGRESASFLSEGRAAEEIVGLYRDLVSG